MRTPLLFVDHGVETADGIILQTSHRAAAVQDEYELCQILLHKIPPIMLCHCELVGDGFPVPWEAKRLPYIHTL